MPRKTCWDLISLDPRLPKRDSASTRRLRGSQTDAEILAGPRTPLAVLGIGPRRRRSCQIAGTAGFEICLKHSGSQKAHTHLVVHYFGVCLFDIVGKERSDAIDHLVEHSAQAPPVDLYAVAKLVAGLVRTRCAIGHFERDQSFFVRPEDLGRYVVTSSTRNQAMTFGEQANPVFCGGEEWGGGSKVDQLDMG